MPQPINPRIRVVSERVRALGTVGALGLGFRGLGVSGFGFRGFGFRGLGLRVRRGFGALGFEFR